MPSPKHNYYTGDLEKKFNYHWEAGSGIDNPWGHFKELVLQVRAGKLRVNYVREQFYSINTPTVAIMSRHAYYRWVRSLQYQEAKTNAS